MQPPPFGAPPGQPSFPSGLPYVEPAGWMPPPGLPPRPPSRGTGWIWIVVGAAALVLIGSCGAVGAAVVLAIRAEARAAAEEERAESEAAKDPRDDGSGTGATGTRNGILHVQSGDFDKQVVQAELPVLVDFYADWCHACKEMQPDLRAFAREMSGKVRVVSIDSDQATDLARSYHIDALPTLLLWNKGTLVQRRVGAIRKSEMKRMVTPYLESGGRVAPGSPSE